MREHMRRIARAKWEKMTKAERSAAGRHAVTLGLKRKKKKTKAARKQKREK